MTGQELYQAIKDSGSSVAEFAKIAGCSERYLRRAFAGKMPVHDNIRLAAEELSSTQVSEANGEQRQ